MAEWANGDEPRVPGTEQMPRLSQLRTDPIRTRLTLPEAARKPASISLVPSQIAHRILLIRGQRVMLSTDLAALYGVERRALIQAVKRNRERFPADFMFQLSRGELTSLKSQSVISSSGWGGGRYAPYAFTEQGVAMLSSVLRSPRAVRVNIEIMRAFVRLRQLLATHADLARKLTELEQRYDGQFRVVFDAIRQLMEPAEETEPRPEIGFRSRLRRPVEARG